MTALQFHQFETLGDNYTVLVHDPDSGDTAAIDAADAEDINAALEKQDWNLTHILVTHHHFDHVQGIADLKAKTGCKVIGPASEADKIKTLDETVEDGDRFEFGGEPVEVITTPGHTLGMVNYHLPESKVVFTGDTLFVLGCGRLFEGDPAMMWKSMQKLMTLPEDTEVYCGHEYTQSNARFALSVDPENSKLVIRAAQIDALRADGKPTVPTSIGEELATNPFMRVGNAGIRKHLGMEAASDEEVFAEIRKRKDNA